MRLNELSSWQRFVLFTTISILILMVLFALAEGAIRVRNWVKHGEFIGVEEAFIYDPETELRLLIPGKEIGATKINSLGFRSPELKNPKPPSTIRVAFIGASTTYSAEVPANNMTWPDLVIRGLSKHWPEENFDYINAGVPGYRAKSSLKYLQLRVSKFDPDIIVIYHAMNDMSANSLDMALARGLVDQSAEQNLMWPSKFSLLWYLVEKNLRVYSHQEMAQSLTEKLEIEPQEFTQTFRSDLTKLTIESKEVSELVYLTTFSYQLRPNQTPEQKNRAAAVSLYYMPFLSVDGLIDGMAAYNQAIRAVAATTGVELIQREYDIPGDSTHFADSVHLTATGSQIMAKRVLEALFESKPLSDLVESRSKQVNGDNLH